jgi:hypothetical protein
MSRTTRARTRSHAFGSRFADPLMSRGQVAGKWCAAPSVRPVVCRRQAQDFFEALQPGTRLFFTHVMLLQQTQFRSFTHQCDRCVWPQSQCQDT